VVARADRAGGQQLVRLCCFGGGGGCGCGGVAVACWARLPDYMCRLRSLFWIIFRLTRTGSLTAVRCLRLRFVRVFFAIGAQSAGGAAVRAVLPRFWAWSGWESTTTSSRSGDSIVSIQLVSRARKGWLVITPRAVFEHQTVAGLAGVASVIGETSARRTLPLEDWRRRRSCAGFWRRGGRLDRFNQAMLLQVPAGLREADLTSALQAVLDHHDVLRLRLEVAAEEGEWKLGWRPSMRAGLPAIRRTTSALGGATSSFHSPSSAATSSAGRNTS